MRLHIGVTFTLAGALALSGCGKADGDGDGAAPPISGADSGTTPV